jgi:hypothetical protein
VSGYEQGEVRLVDALRSEFPRSFAATLRANPDARPFVGEDGTWRLRLGTSAMEFWLDANDVLCFAVQLGAELHTGAVVDGELRFDGPAPLGAPELN